MGRVGFKEIIFYPIALLNISRYHVRLLQHIMEVCKDVNENSFQKSVIINGCVAMGRVGFKEILFYPIALLNISRYHVRLLQHIMEIYLYICLQRHEY